MSSKLGVQNIAHTNGTNAMTVASDGGVYVKDHVVQVKNVMDYNIDDGTTIIPHDNTIPQKTEGDEFLTLAITPKSALSKLKIEVHGFWGTTAANWLTVALFQDDGVNAIQVATRISHASANATNLSGTSLVHFMTAGTTSSTTFKVRVGNAGASTTTMNGINGNRLFGGVMGSGITITEIGG
jgi:hypothetical protein